MIYMDNIGVIICTVFAIFNILLGYMIKKLQLADIIAGFNCNKYDKQRSSEIVGSNFILMGMLMLLLNVLYHLQLISTNSYKIALFLTVLILIIKIIYSMNKHAAIKK